MIYKTKISEPWDGKDYSKTIIHFILHAIIISALFGVAIFLNEGSLEKFINFFATSETRINFVYIILALIFFLAMIYMYFYCEY